MPQFQAVIYFIAQNNWLYNMLQVALNLTPSPSQVFHQQLFSICCVVDTTL